MANDFENSLRFSEGEETVTNCSLTAVSVSLGAPQRAQLIRRLLAQHVWPTYPKDVNTLRSGCQSHSVMGLIGYYWDQVVRVAQSGIYFWSRILELYCDIKTMILFYVYCKIYSIS